MGQQTDSQGAAGVVESEGTWFCETHAGYFWRDLDVYFVTKAEIKYPLTRFNLSNITVDSKKKPGKRGEWKSGIGDDERQPEGGLKKTILNNQSQEQKITMKNK